MLYVSTRSPHDTFTAHRALLEDRTPDGGLYVPFLLPSYSKDDIAQFQRRSFGENVALILNAFFTTKLTGWDVEFCCGRYPVKTFDLPHRLIVAEAWHNTVATYRFMEQALYARLCGNNTRPVVSSWGKIAIGIAMMFAVYGSVESAQCAGRIDLAMDGDDLSLLIAACYARKMGLPLERIICGAVNSSFLWDLIHRGELSISSSAGAFAGIEHLIYLTLGADTASEVVAARLDRKSYVIHDEQFGAFNDGLFVAVVSHDRTHSVIGNFHRSHGYVLDHSAAVSYAALQDYRANAGESRPTLVLSLSRPTQVDARSEEFPAIVRNILK